MGKMMKPLCDTPTGVIMTSHAVPASRGERPEQMFGVAVRLPPNWGQAAIALSVLFGFIMLTVALIWSSGIDENALIAAKDEVIATKDQVIAAKDEHIASLQATNDDLTKAASKTITGLNSADFFAMGGIFLMALSLGCLCSIKALPVAAFAGIAGVILLMTGGG